MPDWLLEIPLVAEGGIVMLALYAMSMVGVALVLERMFVLRRSRVAPSAWLTHVRDVVAQSGLVALGDDAVWPDTPVADALRQTLRHRNADQTISSEAVEQAVEKQQDRLERGIYLIGMFASLATLLGLLGTVLGMIRSFQKIAEGAANDPQQLVGGIYEALYATASGLLVAIVLTVCHRVLRQRAFDLADEIADFIDELLWLDRRGKNFKGQPLP